MLKNTFIFQHVYFQISVHKQLFVEIKTVQLFKTGIISGRKVLASTRSIKQKKYERIDALFNFGTNLENSRVYFSIARRRRGAHMLFALAVLTF